MTSKSIEMTSQWCIFYMPEHTRIVAIWYHEFMKANKQRQLALLYLSNDIMQNSRKKGNQYVEAFYQYMPKAIIQLTRDGDQKVNESVSRLFKVWKERGVFGSRGVQLLLDATKFKLDSVAGSPQEKPEKTEKTEAPRVSKRVAEVSQLFNSFEEEAQEIRKLESQHAEALNGSAAVSDSLRPVAGDYHGHLQTLVRNGREVLTNIRTWAQDIEGTVQEAEKKIDVLETRMGQGIVKEEPLPKSNSPPLGFPGDDLQNPTKDAAASVAQQLANSQNAMSMLESAIKSMSEIEKKKFSAELSMLSPQEEQKPKRPKTQQ
eukprot:CAMPEP_0198236198 /NCGR_PEP_ID=MMETSP1446-20131203/2097_1 /TAXON_ID=1461542 ORGANISM="Unidentified sp, Strain CCMP2111" /NCGR_SAMPLE_ID=MMETSP1446 /ASSEMBLY_ACC=CAM_ASM_001112 /LENGTH=317 /DNA_ID=CAMNT_0043917823 /DNA_START=13 /DNA_END=966 /DNA_ORIENTATION=+